MGFDLGSSQSKTTARTATQSGPVTSSGGNASAIQQFGGTNNQSASNGSIVLGKNASLGSTIISGRGAVVNITSTDNGAFQEAQTAIERIVQGQADNVAAALGSLGNIAETRGTDGANLSAGVASTTSKGIFAAVAVAAALFVVMLFLKHR